MQFGAHAGIIIKQAGWNAHRLEVSRLSRHGRTADAAKVAEAPRRRFEALNQFFAGHEAELVRIDVYVAGEGRPTQFATVAAMAERQGSSRVDLELNPSAKAASLDRHAQVSQLRSDSYPSAI
jgi:hypothetical protein